MRMPMPERPDPRGTPESAGPRADACPFRFDSEALPARDRYAYWKEAVCDSVAGVEINRTTAEPFRGEIRGQGFALDGGEHAFLVDIASVPQCARHGARHIGKETDAWINLVVAREGRSRSSQGGRSIHLGPGDMILKDLTRPSEIHFDQPYRQFVLKIPRRRLASRLPGESLWMSRSVSARSPLGRVLASDLSSLRRAIRAVPPEILPMLVNRTIDLIALIFTGDPAKFGGCGSTVRRSLVVRATGFIDAHLGDPNLSGSMVAGALGISVGYLRHLLQSAETTLTDYALRRRLERCRDELADPARRSEHVSEIAMRWGFRDMPWFSRAFRREFGLAPREHRARAVEGRALR